MESTPFLQGPLSRLYSLFRDRGPALVPQAKISRLSVEG